MAKLEGDVAAKFKMVQLETAKRVINRCMQKKETLEQGT